MKGRIEAIARALSRFAILKARELSRGGSSPKLNASCRECIAALREFGYVVIPDFLGAERCDELKIEIDSTIQRSGGRYWEDDQGSDIRLFAANAVVDGVMPYFHHETLTQIACAYLKSKSVVGYTLANRVVFAPENKGSGGGFHRDNSGLRNFKAILYLTDVTEESGAFQYWAGSHRLRHRLGLIWNNGIQWRGKRFEGAVEMDLIEKQSELKTVTGPRGTLILADTNGIHRGRPVVSGARYALTNYYWRDKDSVPPSMVEMGRGLTDDPIRKY